MTVTCKRDAWSLHVTSMLPVQNVQVSCMQHAEFIQITSMEHAEFIEITCTQHAELIQITCMQHAKFIQISCMQHDDFLHVLHMLTFYKKKTVLHSTIGTKSIVLSRTTMSLLASEMLSGLINCDSRYICIANTYVVFSL